MGLIARGVFAGQQEGKLFKLLLPGWKPKQHCLGRRWGGCHSCCWTQGLSVHQRWAQPEPVYKPKILPLPARVRKGNKGFSKDGRPRCAARTDISIVIKWSCVITWISYTWLFIINPRLLKASVWTPCICCFPRVHAEINYSRKTWTKAGGAAALFVGALHWQPGCQLSREAIAALHGQALSCPGLAHLQSWGQRDQTVHPLTSSNLIAVNVFIYYFFRIEPGTPCVLARGRGQIKYLLRLFPK